MGSGKFVKERDPNMRGCVGTVATDSFSMGYLRFGCGGDPMVILPGASVQGVLGAADAIVDAYAPFAERFTVYLLDYSRALPDPRSVRAMARDVGEALRELGLDEVFLFGASLGGMVSLVLAIERPELVRKLVLGSTAPRMAEDRYRLFERWAQLADAGDAHGLYRSFLEAVYPPDVLAQLIDQDDYPATADDLARFAAIMRSMRGFDVTGELEKISCPVLAVGASDDCIFGADGTLQIAAHLGSRPDFEQHIYSGYGHAAYDTAPDFKDRMMNFFQ